MLYSRHTVSQKTHRKLSDISKLNSNIGYKFSSAIKTSVVKKMTVR